MGGGIVQMQIKAQMNESLVSFKIDDSSSKS